MKTKNIVIVFSIVSIICFIGFVVGLCTMYELHERVKQQNSAYEEKHWFITHMLMTILLPFVELGLGSNELYHLNQMSTA